MESTNSVLEKLKTTLGRLPYKKLDGFFKGLLFVMSIGLFLVLIIRGQDGGFGGMPVHMDNVQAINAGELAYKPHFLFYLVMGLLTYFSTNIKVIWGVGVVLLAFMVIWKYVIARNYFERRLAPSGGEASALTPYGASFLLAFCLMFVHSIPVMISSTMYLGQIMPNLWHNATGLFVMPFALLLFIKSEEFLFQGKEGWRTIGLITLFGVLNVVAKPVYIIAFLPAFGLVALYQSPFGKKFWTALGIGTVSALPLILQYLYYYIWGASRAGGRSIQISPFEVWHIWSDNIPLSFLASLPLPLAYLFLRWGKAKRDRSFGLAALAFVFSMLYFILLKEEGFETSQNFAKGAVIANIILHMVLIGRIGELLYSKRTLATKDLILGGILLIQVGFGIIYWIKMPFFGPW